MNRVTFIKLHRYAGLFMAFFLVVAGTTGIFIAFYDELDSALNPNLFYVEPANDPLEIKKLVNKVEQSVLNGKAKIQYIRFPKSDDRSFEMRITPRKNPETGAAYHLSFDWIFVNPYTGELLGSRLWGAWYFDRAHLMPLIYKLHYSLALPRPWGIWLFGAAALIWFLDCFTGIYLTFPRRREQFFKKWQSSWRIKWQAGAARLIRDSHIALSLWLWGMLLVLALSSVMFNLYREVYQPIVSSVMPYERVRNTLPDVAEEEKTKNIGFASALTQAQNELLIWQKEAEFTVSKIDAINYDSAKHAYRFRVHSSLDLPNSYSQTRLYVSANDGRLLAREYAYHDAGNAFTTWLAALHMGKVFGLWYQIFICVFALVIVVVTVTGVLIWWRKHKTTPDKIKQKNKILTSPVAAPSNQ